MRLLTTLIALAFTTPAFAGGFGILGSSGLHTQPVYYYDAQDTRDQYQVTQPILSYGTGFEVVLGDRDERITGVFRGYWLQDVAETHPSDLNTEIPSNRVVADVRDDPRNIGIATVGVEFGILGQPDGFMFTGYAGMGAGFLTTDHTEFLQLELGPGVAYAFGRNIEAFANVVYLTRYRKGFFHGPNAYAGVRYMFD